ncbi:hypothetical protein M2360_002662 [Rhizobium sp. SG_E_25_P2]|uniref:hypothetical protein n=1 Tax=Rhizobium sp. SG_E_25_P2 TaxID=2879942 RepID=UPI002473A0FC|nr:hypothetical protein [Rhizobium sp. SG_E_25_P2]MDH6267265.1 hypothetical protein [Rhizobium sp. SG_E_25_P2]
MLTCRAPEKARFFYGDAPLFPGAGASRRLKRTCAGATGLMVNTGSWLMPRTVLHLGAHKTATTYIQKKFAQSRGILKRHDVHFYKLEQLRKSFTPLVYGNKKENVAFIAQMAEMAASGNVLISEENILGMAGELVKKGNFYPDVASRVALVIEKLNVEAPVIYICLREYSGFVVSMYCEYLRHQNFIKFETYMDTFRQSGFSWVQVIRDVRASAPKSEIHLWDFAKFRRCEQEILSHMIGFDAALLNSQDESVRESFSNIAMDAYEALAPVLEGKEHRKMLQHLSAAFPRGEQYPAFKPLSDQETEFFQKKYADDLAFISREMEGVSFIV